MVAPGSGECAARTLTASTPVTPKEAFMAAGKVLLICQLVGHQNTARVARAIGDVTHATIVPPA